VYVNHIFGADPSERVPLAGILRAVVVSERDFLPAPEATQLLETYVVGAGGEQPVGRLRVAAGTAQSVEDRRNLVNLTLTARVRTDPGTLDGARAALRVAHEWVVRGFTDMTTPEMHQAWGRLR
jgi:hypothetical protein